MNHVHHCNQVVQVIMSKLHTEHAYRACPRAKPACQVARRGTPTFSQTRIVRRTETDRHRHTDTHNEGETGCSDLVQFMLTGIQAGQFGLDVSCSLLVGNNQIRMVPSHSLHHLPLHHHGLLQPLLILPQAAPPLCQISIHSSFVCSFIHSFMPSFIHTFICSFIYPPNPSFILFVMYACLLVHPRI